MVFGSVCFGLFVFFVVILISLILIKENVVIWNVSKNLVILFGKKLL